MFWSLVQPEMKAKLDSTDPKTEEYDILWMKYYILLINNTVPAVILMTDFFINCVPFIMRHFIFYFFIEFFIVLEGLYEDFALEFVKPF